MSDLFGETLQSAMQRRAEISQCGSYRWTLQRRWGPEKRVCWIMLNPSTADHEKDDPTIRRCIQFSKSWGYGALVVVNLYPLRSPHPKECKRWSEFERNGPDWYARDMLQHNQTIVARAAKTSDLVVAAWGATAWDENWTEQIIEEVTSGEEPWPSLYCLGTSANGSPKHPLARGTHRIPDDQRPILWRAA